MSIPVVYDPAATKLVYLVLEASHQGVRTVREFDAGRAGDARIFAVQAGQMLPDRRYWVQPAFAARG